MSAKQLVLYKGKWHLYWREDGKPVRRSLGTDDRKEAQGLAADLEKLEDIQAARDPTVEDLWRAYQAHLDGRPAAAQMDFEWRALEPHFGNLRPAEVTPKIVAAYRAQREAAGRSQTTIAGELARLTSALRHAEKHDVIERAPHISKPTVAPPRERHLTRDEAARFRDAIVPAHGRLFFVLAVATAARKGALFDLTWDRVDLERGLIRLADPAATRRMKGRAVVPVNGQAAGMLRAAKELARSDFVIEYAGQPVRSVRTCFAEAERRSGVLDVTPHVLRHTAAVWLAEDGVSMAEISQYLGHRDSRITERVYARFSPDYLRKASASLEF